MREAGLINAVVHAEALDAHVRAWVEQLSAAGPIAVSETKKLLRTVPTMSRDDGFAMTAALSARLFDAAAEAWADEKTHGRDTEHDDETEQ